MTEEETLQIPNLLSLLRGKLMMKGHLHSAAMTALLAHALADGDIDGIDRRTANEWLFLAVDEIRRKANGEAIEPEEPACSFCGRSGEGVRLAAGAYAFICDECVHMLANEVFKSESAP